MSTKIKLIAPVLFSAGENLDGVELHAPRWVMSGEAEVADARALELERDGYADIVSINGSPAMWPSCCADSGHSH